MQKTSFWRCGTSVLKISDGNKLRMHHFLSSRWLAGLVLVLLPPFAAATVIFDNFRGDSSVSAPLLTPNFSNYPNNNSAQGLQNLISFSADSANIASSGTAPNIDWGQSSKTNVPGYSSEAAQLDGLCSIGATASSANPMCIGRIMGKVVYALVKFPVAGNYEFTTAHDDDVKFEFSSQYNMSTPANYRAYNYNVPVGGLASWTADDATFSHVIQSNFQVAKANTCYVMRVYWLNAGGINHLRLKWTTPGSSASTLVPAENLFDPSNAASYNGCVAEGSDIGVSKTATTAAYPSNGTINYKIKVWNYGPASATGVAIADAIPANTTLQGTPTCVASGSATCGYAPTAVNNTTVLTTGSLPVNTSAGNATTAPTSGSYLEYSLSVNVNGSPTSITNTAVVTSVDNNTGNNTSSVTTTLSNTGVVVAKTGALEGLTSGPYVYTLTVTNTGPSTTNANMRVRDQLPSGVIATAVSGATCTPLNTAGALLTCQLPSTLAGSATQSFTITATLPSTPGTITNYASVNKSGSGTPTAPGASCVSNGTNSCTSSSTIVKTPASLVTGKALATINGTAPTAGQLVHPGDKLVYRITVANGGGTAGNTTLTETVPAGTSYSGTAEGWSCTGSSCTQTVNAAANASPSVNFTVTVNTPGTVSAINNSVASSTGTCTNCTVSTTAAQADMSSTTTSTATTVNVPVTVSSTCTNNGPQAATNATCAVSVSGYPGAATTCTPVSPVVSLTAATTPVGTNQMVCTTTFTPTTAGSVTVTTTAGSDLHDPTPGNNVTTGAVTVNTVASLVTGKALATINGTAPTAGQLVHPGDKLVYRITVANGGGTAGNTTLTETVPAGTSYSGTAEGWSCTGSSCTQTVNAAANASPSVNFTVTVGAALTRASINNTVGTSAGACAAAPGSCSVSNPVVEADMEAIPSASIATTVGTPVTVATSCVNNSTTTAALNVGCAVTGAPADAVTSCKVDNVVVTLPLSSLAAGKAIHCETSFTPASAGTVTITTTATSSSYDPNTGNNTVTTTLSTSLLTDMAVVITGPDTAPLNQPVTLVSTCTNNGPHPAVNARCSPSAIVEALGTCAPGSVCARQQAVILENTSCVPSSPVASLPVGGSLVCTTVFTPTSVGAYTLTAATSNDLAEVTLGNNTAQHVVTTYTVAPAAGAKPVPMNERWALVLLALSMLVCMGWIHGKNRRRAG